MPPEPTVDQLLAEAEEHLRQSEPLAGADPRWVQACVLRAQHAAARALVATVRGLCAAGGGPEVPPRSDLDEAFERGRRAGRQQAARAIRDKIGSYEDESSTDGERDVAHGLRVAARLAEGDTDGTDAA